MDELIPSLASGEDVVYLDVLATPEQYEVSLLERNTGQHKVGSSIRHQALSTSMTECMNLEALHGDNVS